MVVSAVWEVCWAGVTILRALQQLPVGPSQKKDPPRDTVLLQAFTIIVMSTDSRKRKGGAYITCPASQILNFEDSWQACLCFEIFRPDVGSIIDSPKSS